MPEDLDRKKDDIKDPEKQGVHRSFEERLAEYNGEIAICDFEWGDPVGEEIL